MAQWVKRLPWKPKDLGLILRPHKAGHSEQRGTLSKGGRQGQTTKVAL